MSNLGEALYEEAFERGIKKGKMLMLFELVDDGVLSLENAAKHADMSVENFEKAKEKGI